MSHSGLKLSVLTKVGLVFLVVALSVAGVYLVTQVVTPSQLRYRLKENSLLMQSRSLGQRSAL